MYAHTELDVDNRLEYDFHSMGLVTVWLSRLFTSVEYKVAAQCRCTQALSVKYSKLSQFMLLEIIKRKKCYVGI